MTDKKQRSDGWTEEMDNTLAQITLAHLREGKTAKTAFTVVADELDRTDSAVQFRWNTVVKSRYEDAVKLARKQGNAYKKAMREQNAASKKVSLQKTNNTQEKIHVKELEENLAPQPENNQAEIVSPTLRESTAPSVKSDVNAIYSTDFMTLAMDHFKEFETMRAEIEELRQKDSSGSNELEETKAELLEAKKQIEALQHQSTNSEELQRLSKENDKFKADLNSLQQENNSLKQENEKLKIKNKSLEKDLGDFNLLAQAVRNLESGREIKDDESEEENVAS